jgi:hypothetical protein
MDVTGFISLRMGPVMSSSEHGFASSGLIKAKDFPSDY